MLTQVHILLTYTCNYECEHCFLYCSPRAKGTFTLAQVREVLAESKKLGTVEWIYFEGGEPFLFFPLLKESLRLAMEAGFKTGLVTNCYWATAEEDANLWLGPLLDNGIEDLSLSDDAFHHGKDGESPAKLAVRAAADLAVDASPICIEGPTTQTPASGKGQPVVGGGVLFKGRAADNLTEGLPTRPTDDFTECTREELVAPSRVHVDSYGHVYVCQGVSIGNLWERPFSEIIRRHDAASHSICGPLVKGGPLELARAHRVMPDGPFVDECHF